MRQAFIPTSGFLATAVALILALSPLHASENLPAIAFHSQKVSLPESQSRKFDIIASQCFFLYSNEYPGIGLLHMQGNSYPRSVAPSPDYRSLEEQVTDCLTKLLIQYPGGKLVSGALQSGLEILNYTKDITTYGYRNFYTGYDFKTKGINFLRTGIFCEF